ncbi:MAG: branched-chain amino acid ABC transporter permease [Desulfobacterales bacterium]|jgi:branched-chain amino acid transport system permease protein|nr:branched-chain amino acid ABC transporter permease [Desulfobacterales bacterium]
MTRSLILSRSSFGWSAALLLVLLLVPAWAGRFTIYILAFVFVMALLAMSLNLLVGHGGIYQFHHAAFYGVGAYTAGLIAAKTAWPVWVGFCAGPLMAAAAGWVIGLFCVRLNKLYFGMLQISLGSLIWIIALRWYSLTAGDDGIHGIRMPELLSGSVTIYYFLLAVVTVCLLSLYLVYKSPFGVTLRAIRDNPQRCEAVGINVRRHQLLAIIIATFFAGVAGVLFVVLEGSIFPDMLFWVLSLEILIMCLLGGWFTFFGPVVGAAIMVTLRTFVGSVTEYWTMVLGIVLILLIFFLPEGIMGINFRNWSRRRSRRAAARAAEDTDAAG